MTETKSIWDQTIKGMPGIGAHAVRVRRTTPEDVERFAEMTGDRNPLHFDENLAAATPLGGLVVQGGVTTGLLNAAVAEDLPGPGTVFLETNWRFVKAVRIGENITAHVTVTDVRSDKPICKLETRVTDESGDDCVTGTAVTYTMALT